MDYDRNAANSVELERYMDQHERFMVNYLKDKPNAEGNRVRESLDSLTQAIQDYIHYTNHKRSEDEEEYETVERARQAHATT